MFRFIISMVWGVISAVLVYAADATLFTSFLAGIVLALLLGLTLFVADTITIQLRPGIKKARLINRLVTWLTHYALIPAGAIYVLSVFCGLFVLPHGMLTALAMCLPISLITLRDYVDLSWLSR